MKKVLLTGCTSGIGKNIAKRLIELDYEVYGIGRNFSECENLNFHKISCDLRNLSELERTLHSIKRIDFDLIINSAGLAYFGPHEEINIGKIKEMIAVNLQAPLFIIQFFLRTLKNNKGMIINISSITAKKQCPFAAVYSATKAGLTHFSKSLFEEVRKYGVKIVTLHPDMVKTNFYKNSYFECSDDENYYINTNDIVETIEFILKTNSNIVINEVTILPQKNAIKKKGKKE